MIGLLVTGTLGSNDSAVARGNMWGDEVGEALRLSASDGGGAAGGGTGEGIGLGKIGTLGHADADGSVSSVEDAGSDLPDAQVVSCVVGTYNSLAFPQPDDGSVRVVYSLTFSPG